MRRLLGGLLLIGAALGLAAPALADPVASLTNASWSDSRLTVDLLAKSVPLGFQADGLAADVTVAGTTVPGNVTFAGVEVPDTATVQSLMLIIDASGSMTGERQRATTRAVKLFLASAPANAEIGVIAFSARARVLTKPTTDRAAVLDLVSNLRPTGDTAIFDAVRLGTKTLADSTPCTMLVLTDGEDTASRSDLTAAQASLGDSPCTASFIGLQADKGTIAALQSLAEAGRGRVFRAVDAEGIAGVFVQSFTTTNASIAITADFPAGFADRNRTISIDLKLGANHVGLTGRADPVADNSPVRTPSQVLLTLAVVLFLSVFVLIWLLSEGSDRARRRRVESLIAEYAMKRVPSREEPEEDTVLETLEDLIRPVLARTRKAASLTTQLDGASVNMSPELWTLLRMASAAGLALVAGLPSASPAAALAVGAPIGWLLPQLWLARRRSKRGKQFEAGLPDALMLMASSLRSGFSLDQAIVAASDQSENEVSKELRRAVQEIRIGSPLEAALERIAERMDSSDFTWVVTALRIQRKSGGNLAELLVTVSHTVRQRAQMGREVAALTAEGRLSAYVLIGLPLALFAFLMLTQPSYLEPLWTTSTGLMMTAVGGVMLLIGWLLMKRMVKVDV